MSLPDLVVDGSDLPEYFVDGKDFLFTKVLVAAGFVIPDETAKVELLAPVDGLVQLRFTANVQRKDLPTIVRALQVARENR